MDGAVLSQWKSPVMVYMPAYRSTALRGRLAVYAQTCFGGEGQSDDGGIQRGSGRMGDWSSICIQPLYLSGRRIVRGKVFYRGTAADFAGDGTGT